MIITTHAVERLIERFFPGLEYDAGKERLISLLAEAEELLPPALWRYVNQRDFSKNCEYYVHHGVRCVFAVKIDREGRQVLMTCLHYCEPPKPAKGARHGGAKYRGRLGIRMANAYKRERYRPGEDDAA